MNFKPILIVAGEPNSIFSELFIKTLKKKKFNSPIILICSKKQLIKQAKFLKKNIKFNELTKDFKNYKNYKFKKINLINVEYEQDKPFDKISSKSNKYIEESFEIALKLIELSEVPIAAPSANKFTRLSPTTAEHVANQLGSKVSIILDGGKCSVGVESTIIAFIEDEFVLLRPGGLPVNQIENVVGKIKIKSVSDNPIAPGMLPFHYAPKVKIKFLNDVNQSDLLNKKVGGLFFSENKSSIKFDVVKILSTKRDYIEAASNLFSMLHEFELEDLDLILVERVPEENLGIAIMDRLTKAVNKYS